MLRLGAGRLAQLGKSATLTGAGVALPAALSGALGRWDAYSGIVADTTNGGFKWNPETGSSVLQTISGTGPDYSATGLSGRPAMLLSAGKSLISSPGASVGVPGQFLFMAVLQLPAPSGNGIILGNSTNGYPLLRVVSDGSLSIERQNQSGIATVAAGAFPFNTRVLLTYGYNAGQTVKHMIRVNKVLQSTTNDTVSGGYSTGANAMQIGRVGATSGATDLVGFVSYVDLSSIALTGTTLTDYESAIYNRWVA